MTIAAVAAVLIGAVAGWFVGVRRRRPREVPPAQVQRHDQDVSAAVLRRLLESMQTAVVVLDADGEVTLANPPAHAIGAVRDRSLAPAELHQLVRLARSTGYVQDLATQIPGTRLRRDPRAVRVSVVPLGHTAHVAVFLDDVTEARRLAAARRDFVANTSHELKTPVGALMLLSEAMEEASDDPDAVRHFAARMGQEGRRLARLVGELIDLSRLEGVDPLPDYATIPVDGIIGEAVEQTRAAAESAGIHVAAGGRSGLAVHGDRAQLITAVVNLLGNAIAYSPQQTKVAVGTRLRPAIERPAGDTDEPDDDTSYVEISVADQGIGIAEPDLERIFERFYRADPARSRATGGSGLGLAIVKHIATNHGGDVTVWSVEGSGSTFTLRLPAAESPAAAAAAADAMQPGPSPSDSPRSAKHLSMRGNA